MIDWYVEISEYAPYGFRSDKYKDSIITNSMLTMDHICKEISKRNYDLSNFEKSFNEIIQELPIMNFKVLNGEFIIVYNKWVNIRFKENTKQIYRDIKLNKLIN